jgi:hypothetical protein
VQDTFARLAKDATETKIYGPDEHILIYGPLERIVGNTGDYTGMENRGGTFPIGEMFTEAQDLSTVHGSVVVEAYPDMDFAVVSCTPFVLHIQGGMVVRSEDIPAGFLEIYDMIHRDE